MITSLRTAIYTKALTVTGLNSSNFFFKKFPKSMTGYPRYYYYEIINPHSGRTTKSNFEESHIDFCLKGSDQDALEIVAKAIRAKFDNSESGFSLTDYFVLQIISKGCRDSESFEDPVV